MQADWLEKFYADDRHLDFRKAMRGEYKLSQINALIQKAHAQKMPCIIPSARSGRTVFYGLAQNGRSLDELRRVLTAALGSADTNADIRTLYHSTDPGELLLLERSPEGILAFHFLPVTASTAKDKAELQDKRRKRVFAMLQTVMDLYHQRPVLHTLVSRQTGRILRDFYTACHARDGKAAEEYLQELRGNQALSPLNLQFLELQGMAASAKWEAILTHPRLDVLLKGRVPERIQRLLLRSTGHYLMNAIQEANFPATSKADARRLALDMLPLYKTKPAFAHHESFLSDWKLWAMGAALLGIKEWQKATPILHQDWLQQVEHWVTEAVVLPVIVKEAEQKLIQAPVITLLSVDDAIALLLEAFTADVERENEIYAQMITMPEATKQALQVTPKHWEAWLALKKRCEPEDYGWSRWLLDVQQAKDNQQYELLRQQLTMQYMDWLPFTFNEQQWLGLLSQQPVGMLGQALRDVLPNMLQWLIEYDINVSSSLWSEWLMLLALEGVSSVEDVRLGGIILDALLSGTFSHKEYHDALEAIEMLCAKNESSQTLGYALDIAEILFDRVCGDDARRLQYWVNIQEMLVRRWERLDTSMQLLARMVERLYLGQNAGNTFPTENTPAGVASPLHRDLSGKKLVIYSLTESAARRGKDALIKLYPELSIELNNDHVATDALMNAARKADYFIFASSSSKHQAFYAVASCRKDIIYPAGKGASSMVAAFIRELA
ncbi:hypothetical protein AW879_21010 [Enterobacter cloacae]|nr:protein DpdD [Enterobacter cloacae]AMJ72281.1 hypothetical protein AW879_21010 [Enterobacter cloacae]EJC0566766.1 hypothetical protein [Enterobacter cloacae]EJC0567965.1 hypothetical protein [Enterobacter cloacae]